MICTLSHWIVNATNDLLDVEDLSCNLTGHDISIIPVGNGSKGIGFFDSRADKYFFVNPVSYNSGASKIWFQAPEGFAAIVDNRDCMSFTIHHSSQSCANTATTKDHNFHFVPPVSRNDQHSICSFVYISGKKTGLFNPLHDIISPRRSIMSLNRYVLRSVSAVERKKWDQFVNDHPGGHFLQSWGWGELKASIGWHPFRFSLWDEEQQQVVAAAQVLRRTALALPSWAGSLAYIPKGPVIDWSDPMLCRAFFTQLNAYLHARGALALRMEPNRAVSSIIEPTPGAAISPACKDTYAELTPLLALYPAPPVQPVRSIVLNLMVDETTLLAGMKEKWRYNVRLAERKGVTVRSAQTVEDVQTW